MGDASAYGLFGVATSNEDSHDTSTAYDQEQKNAITGPNYGGANSSDTALALTNTSVTGGITLNQESPQAIAALQAGTQTALEAVGSVAGSATNAARATAERAFELAGANSGTAANQIEKLLISVGLIAALLGGIYFYARAH